MSREILQKYNIKAKKSLGQNFLVDENILQNIAEIEVISGKNIVEIGPGYGALTEKIREKNPASLTLVELDRDMIDILEERFATLSPDSLEPELKIIHQDVLAYIPEFADYTVIANIPYYITSPILRHFLYTLEHPPKSMLILMQKDVGDKILGYNKSKSSVISLFVEKKCRVTEKIRVPKESFIPVPKVESSVLHFEIHSDFTDIDDEQFLRIIKIGFAEPRKKLINNLVKGGFAKEKILEFICLQGRSENMRADEGDIKFWCEIVQFLL